MSTLALKDSLHRLVVETEDDMLLQQVQLFFLSLKEKKESKDPKSKSCVKITLLVVAASCIISKSDVRTLSLMVKSDHLR